MLGVGLLGAGPVAAAHARAYARLPDVELVAVADVDRAAVERLAHTVGARPYYGITPLLDDPAVEMVDICLPTRVHEQAVVAAAQAGKHILCETPLATNLAEADRMQMAVQAASVRSVRGRATHPLAMVVAAGRFASYYQIMRDWLAAGRLGAPLAFSVARLSALSEGYSLLDLHVHDLDVIYGLFGRPARIYARGVADVASSAWNHLFCSLDYGSHQVWAEAGFLAPADYPFTMSCRLVGAHGALEYPYCAPSADAAAGGENALWAYLPGQPPQQIPLPADDPYDRAITYFIGCIQRGEPPAVGTLAEARAVLNIALAAMQSAENGQIIEL